jgi:peptidoglycan/LPS O-acetylase OafA/YrhL
MRKISLFAFALIAALSPALAFAQTETDPGNSTPLGDMSDYALWAAVAGVIGVWVVSTLNQYHWKSTTKYAIFFAWCIIAAGVDAYFKRQLDLHYAARALMIVFLTGQVTYLVGKPAIKEWEQQTTVTTPSAPPTV